MNSHYLISEGDGRNFPWSRK